MLVFFLTQIILDVILPLQSIPIYGLILNGILRGRAWIFPILLHYRKYSERIKIWFLECFRQCVNSAHSNFLVESKKLFIKGLDSRKNLLNVFFMFNYTGTLRSRINGWVLIKRRGRKIQSNIISEGRE